NKDEQFIGGCAVESPRANRPLVRINLGHFQIRGQAQRLGDAGRAKTMNVFLRDYLNGRSGLKESFRALGNRSDLNIHELFQAQSLQHSRICLRGSEVRMNQHGESDGYPREPTECTVASPSTVINIDQGLMHVVVREIR